MHSKSIGYIEVIGLPSAIVAADRMLKTAGVKLANIENTKGGGYITVSVNGDVAAVEAAISAGKSLLLDKVVSAVVIPNPASGITELGKSDAIKGSRPKNKVVTELDADNPITTLESSDDIQDEADTEMAEDEADLMDEEALNDSEDSDEETSEEDNEESDSNVSDKKATCNLCGDPDCPRKIGEPHKKCIHYEELEGKNKK